MIRILVFFFWGGIVEEIGNSMLSFCTNSYSFPSNGWSFLFFLTVFMCLSADSWFPPWPVRYGSLHVARDGDRCQPRPGFLGRCHLLTNPYQIVTALQTLSAFWKYVGMWTSRT